MGVGVGAGAGVEAEVSVEVEAEEILDLYGFRWFVGRWRRRSNIGFSSEVGYGTDEGLVFALPTVLGLIPGK